MKKTFALLFSITVFLLLIITDNAVANDVNEKLEKCNLQGDIVISLAQIKNDGIPKEYAVSEFLRRYSSETLTDEEHKGFSIILRRHVDTVYKSDLPAYKLKKYTVEECLGK